MGRPEPGDTIRLALQVITRSLTGLQDPFSRLASRIFAAGPQMGGSREQGSLLGGVATGTVLGGIFGGDDE